MKKQFHIFISISLCLTCFAYAEDMLEVQNTKKRVNAPVFKKLYKGVNADTANPDRVQKAIPWGRLESNSHKSVELAQHLNL